MNFKQYYHNKINEDQSFNTPLDPEQEYTQQKQIANSGTININTILNYTANNTSLKIGLKQLGEDIGNAIVEYATNQAVKSSDFKSEDDYIKYTQDIRTNIAEKQSIVLKDLLSSIGLYIDNKIHTNSLK